MDNIAVVGAGLAGVMAARTLEKRGFSTTVFDRGRRLGGRCSSRDREQTFDHGAQFLTITDQTFDAAVDTLRATGVVKPWRGKFQSFENDVVSSEKDATKFVGVPTMRSLVEAFAGELTIENDNHIKRIEMCARGWRVINSDDSDLGEYDAVVLAMAPEQIRSLLPSESTIFPATSTVKSLPCWALMMEFKERLPISFDGGSLDHAAIKWVARDSSKPGRPSGERWVAHTTASWADANLKANPEIAATEIYTAFLDALELPNAPLVSAKAHRWRLGSPQGSSTQRAYWDDELQIAVCGDWCIDGRLEGAYLSGVACGELLAGALAPGTVSDKSENQALVTS